MSLGPGSEPVAKCRTVSLTNAINHRVFKTKSESNHSTVLPDSGAMQSLLPGFEPAVRCASLRDLVAPHPTQVS